MIDKQLKNNICKIICGDKQGTGFLINRNLILTAYHIVDQYAKKPIRISLDGLDIEVKLHEHIDDTYKKMDIAVLELEDTIENYHHIELVDIELNSGTKYKWETRGYPLFKGKEGAKISLDSRTYINDQLKELHEKNDLELNIDKKFNSYRGFSGSPLIVNNNIVGIIKSELLENGEAKELSALSVKYYKDLLEKLNIRVLDKFFTPLDSKIGLKSLLVKDDMHRIKFKLEDNLNNALKAFSTQPKVFIEPRIYTNEENHNQINNNDTRITTNELLNIPQSLVIKARQQYGLTSLAHYLINEAWKNNTPTFWLYLDASKLSIHTNEIRKYIDNILKDIKLSFADIRCIVLDEFSANIENASIILKKVSEIFDNISIIVMYTELENSLFTENISLPDDRVFDIYFLWSLERNGIRQIVTKYNDEQAIGDENSVVTKIAKDLEVLNIPRTPYNCLTILKISENDFDDSPVNRTEMLGKILALLFNVDDIPQFKRRPDLKDTEFVLGYFAEKIIREDKYVFSRDYFLEILDTFCDEELIDLDIDIVFTVLYDNNIIVFRQDSDYCFKFRYWVFYFAAHRMFQNPSFADFILDDMHYVSYPEIIEFYTGIDRRRDNAIEKIINDISNIRNEVERKSKLSINIYDRIQWKPSKNKIEEMHKEVEESVMKSNLPDNIKDQYADKSYNPMQTHDQSIHSILEELALLRLMKTIIAGSRALRNSDYVSRENKEKLLAEILTSWEQVIKVVLILVPPLAKNGHATLDGATFGLIGNFGITLKERFNNIVSVIPSNIVFWYQDDLFSPKMGPLLYKYISDEKNNLIKHVIYLMLVDKRPKNWKQYIEKYIETENKNSFYLLDILNRLKVIQKYSFCTNGDLKGIDNLIQMIVKKHELGIKEKPSKKALKEKPILHENPIEKTVEAKKMTNQILKIFGLNND